jgi:peptidyl-prolyl cis-trans isomerase A (cyclophilin A)
MNVRRAATLTLIALAVAVTTQARPAAQTPAGAAKPAGADTVVVMKTSMGEIKIKLNKEKAPISVENFLAYVNKKFYDGTVFHRIIPTFMIQGGGHLADLSKKPTAAPIKLESMNGLKNARGTVAMARTGDPNSATAQFFINVVDNPALDAKAEGTGYAVSGEVIAGMEVVDKIKAVPTTTKNGMQNVPVEPVIIESIRVGS